MTPVQSGEFERFSLHRPVMLCDAVMLWQLLAYCMIG